MEALFTRYRNLTVLFTVVIAQLLYLAYQVRTNRDERLIRVWAVTTVTPMAGIVEAVRHNTIGFLEDYFILLDVREQNRKLKADNDRLRMENVYYRNQLGTAEHAHALTLFEAQSPNKTVAARVIGNSTVSTAKAVFIDRGSTSGVERGMAVVTPEGIVGKVVAVYPLVSQVLLVTDPTFKVGVESQKRHVHGLLDCGSGKCSVEQIPNEERIDSGEWFFTSGEDRIFPKGFPVGTAVSVSAGQGSKDIKLNLSGAPAGADEVLVILQGVHQEIPTAPPVEVASATLPPPPAEAGKDADQPVKPQTQADKVEEKYVEIGRQQGHVYGAIGSNMPNFNLQPEGAVKTANLTPNSPPSPSVLEGSPAVLGARPSAPKPAPAAIVAAGTATTGNGPKPDTTEPVLPLGTPRHKPPQAQQKTIAPSAHPEVPPSQQ